MRSNSSTNAIPGTDAPAAGFGLARRVARRTTDLLAIAIVAIAGISIGDRLIEWWSTDPAAVSPPLPAGTPRLWGTGSVPVVFEFCEQPLALARQRIAGDASRAAEALRTWCRERVTEAPLPAGDVTAAEQKLLDRLAATPGASERAGDGRIVWLEEPLPLAVGLVSNAVRWDNPGLAGAGPPSAGPVASGPASSHPPAIVPQPSTNPRAMPAERVVCWGIVFPAGDQRWTLFGFEFRAAGGPVAESRSPLPLPPGSRRILAFDDPQLGGMAAFDGTGTANEWIEFYQSMANRAGWRLKQPWHQSGSSHGARYQTSENPPARIDIQITTQPGNRLLGLMSIERQVGFAKGRTAENKQE